MGNKFLIPILIVLIFSLIYNFLLIDERMNFFKNENLTYSIGVGLSFIGILVAIIYFRLNNLNSFIKKKREELS